MPSYSAFGDEPSRNASMMKPHPLDDEFRYLKLSVPLECSHVVIVALNRPHKRNAINRKMWLEIGDCFSRLGSRGDDCRCIIVIGIGKAFSAGIDISDTELMQSEVENEDFVRAGLAFLPKIRDMQRCFTAIEECPVPVIAAIHGNCIGAGVDLACCCDIRMAQTKATFSVREVRIGLAADIGTLQRLPKITGNDSRVRELCLTGEIFDEKEAARIGFVSRVSGDVIADAIELASTISSNSPVAVFGTKRSLLFSRDHTVAEGLDHIASHNAFALMTSELPTAVMATSRGEQAEFSNLPRFSRL